MAIDIRAAIENDPPPLDHLFPGGPLAGTVGLIASAGSAGKSYYALQAAAAIAARNAIGGGEDGDLLGLNVPPDPHYVAVPEGIQHPPGRVVMLAAEDPEAILIHRLRYIFSHIKNPNVSEDVYQNFKIEPILGRGVHVTNPEYQDRIIKYCDGARLIIFDTLIRFHDLDESNNGEMSRLISIFENIAVETGACVLYLHHINKLSSYSGQGDHQHAGRGASALTDNARWVASLQKMTKDEAERYSMTDMTDDERQRYVRWSNPKNNYARTLADRWYHRDENGVLLPANLIAQNNSNRSKNPSGPKPKGNKRESATY